MPKPYFRSNYAEVKTQFEPPFDNCVCIPLTKGQHTLIDAEDYYKVCDVKWRAGSFNRNGLKFYAYGGVASSKSKGLHMHRIIADTLPDELTDHINGNPLDNRKSNLRKCDHLENKRNSSPYKGKKYKGVCLSNRSAEWRARIRVSGNLIDLGCYFTEEDAALAYDAAALKYFSGFARLNFPELGGAK